MTNPEGGLNARWGGEECAAVVRSRSRRKNATVLSRLGQSRGEIRVQAPLAGLLAPDGQEPQRESDVHVALADLQANAPGHRDNARGGFHQLHFLVVDGLVLDLVRGDGADELRLG